MKSDEYWARRQAQNMYEHMEGAERIAQEIAQLYLKASRYISAQADGIFEKYMTKYGLAENEARKLLNELRDKSSLDELLEKLRNGSNNESREELRKQLEAPAYQARLERLRQLQNQIDMVMTQVYRQELQKNTSYYTDLGNEAYYKSMFNIQQQAGAAFSFSCIDAETIDRVVNSRWSGENYSERIWKNTRTLANNLKEELLLGVVTGKTYREMANEIQNKYAAGAYNARRLVRTEGNFVATEINFKAYEEAEIEKYRFCAILDLRTSEVCRDLDGKAFLVKERKVGVNCPPMHPFCRSTTIAEFSAELAKKMIRRARDPATGKPITVPLSMTYREWYDKYVKGRPEAELAEKQLRNRSADRAQWKKYRAILGENVPKKLDEFQKMKYNEPEKWELLRTYVRSVKSGMISPLSGFKNYEKIYGEINRNIVGVKTSEGTEVSGQSKHFMERVVGTMKDPKTGRPRSGVTVDGIKDALENPLKVLPVRIASGGDKSQKYIGRNGTVAINPDSGVLIQCNPTDADCLRRIESAKI